MSFDPRISCVLILVAALAAQVFAASTIPEGVSPGTVERIATIRGECPTFSWGAVPGVEFYEVVVYELCEGFDPVAEPELAAGNEALYERVVGSATVWIPELERSLVPGSSYVWHLRAVFDEDGELVAGEWSPGRFFSVAEAPTAAQVQHALDVLRRYTAESGSELDISGRISDHRDGARAIRRTQTARRSEGTSSKLSVGTAPTAINAEMPDSAGETYGVVGVSNSPDGAGIGAVNTAGGADLVLDGSAQGAADTELNEWGIDRPSDSPQIFGINNTDGAGMTLQVDGVNVVTTATDHDTLAGLPCSGGEVAKWNGSSWACASDDDTQIWQLNGGKIYTFSPVGIDTTDPQNSLSIGGVGDSSFKATIRYNDNSFANLASYQEGVYGEGWKYGVHGKDHFNENHGYLGVSGKGVLGEGTTLGVHGIAGTTGVKGENAGGDYGYLAHQNSGVYGVGILKGVYGFTFRDETANIGFRSMGVHAQVIMENASGWVAGIESTITGSTVSGNFFSGHFVGTDMTGEGTYYGLFADIRTGDPVDIAEFIYGLAEPGDVVVSDPENPETVILSVIPYDTTVVGIVSTRPHLLMGMEIIKDDNGNILEDVDAVKLALAGRVPVKVTGPVNIGDLLTTSSLPGHAMRCDDISICMGAIVGKALEENTDGEGVIVALVSLQ